MKIGIVGHERSKFTPELKEVAKEMIRAILLENQADTVVSGACHLGGIDIWAAQIGREMGIKVVEFPPATKDWHNGFKPRNIKIAEESDRIYCLVVRELPSSYKGMRFDQGCYHCKTPPEHHVKSGGCWTMKYARQLLKPTQLIVIQ